MNSETQPITISVNEDGQIYLQETEIPLDEVVAKLTAIATTGYEERIYVRGDKTTNYGTVMQVMARISAAGFTQDRPRDPAGTGRYLKHEDRPHDIGGDACGRCSASG